MLTTPLTLCARVRGVEAKKRWPTSSAEHCPSEIEDRAIWICEISGCIDYPIFETLTNAMRLLCEIFFIGALIYLGWEKPFRQWVPGASKAQPAVVTASPAAAPQPQLRPWVRAAATPSGDWMWDPAHRSTLDRPAYNPNQSSQNYQDEGSARYWIDGRGVRHSYDSSAPPSPP